MNNAMIAWCEYRDMMLLSAQARMSRQLGTASTILYRRVGATFCRHAASLILSRGWDILMRLMHGGRIGRAALNFRYYYFGWRSFQHIGSAASAKYAPATASLYIIISISPIAKSLALRHILLPMHAEQVILKIIFVRLITVWHISIDFARWRQSSATGCKAYFSIQLRRRWRYIHHSQW